MDICVKDPYDHIPDMIEVNITSKSFICHTSLYALNTYLFRCCVCSCPHLPDRGPAGGCVPAGRLQVRAAPLPAPPPHTERTGTRTGSSPGSYRAAHHVVNTLPHTCNKLLCQQAAFRWLFISHIYMDLISKHFL